MVYGVEGFFFFSFCKTGMYVPWIDVAMALMNQESYENGF